MQNAKCRVALRCRWQMQQRISECRGRWATQSVYRQGDHRAPQTYVSLRDEFKIVQVVDTTI
ncbi:MAG: hypothetical protein J6Q92_01700 [Oscillospiraceae bacterium]|nr:hypothetical protein [Oscillospiraceae bacterium]